MIEAVRGRYVLTGDIQGSVIEDGAVVFDGGTILDLGPLSEMRATYNPVKVYGSPDHVVLPGLVNSHSHGLGINLLRVGPGDEPLERWFINTWYHPDGKRVPVFYENTLINGLKMLKSGVTTVVHHHYFSEANSENHLEVMTLCLQAYRDLGLRVAFAPFIRDRHQFAYLDDNAFISSLPAHAVDSLKKIGKIPVRYPTAEQYFQAFDKLKGQHKSDYTRFLFGPAGPQWCTSQLLKEIKERSESEDIGIHTHVLESPMQRKYGEREYFGGLIGYLEELGLLNSRLTLVHGVQVTEKEIKKLAFARCKVAHNPSSNLRLFNGVAPIREMVDAGLSVGLGMDSTSLDDDEDMFREMRLCSILQRPQRIDASPMPSSIFLHMNVSNGARITQFEDIIGPLERGKKADLILLDFLKMEEPFIGPEADLHSIILHLATKEHVDTVFIDGCPVVEQGKSNRIDEAKLLQDIRQKYQLKGDDPESKQLRRSMIDELIHIYSGW